jgi:hypothetical protein
MRNLTSSAFGIWSLTATILSVCFLIVPWAAYWNIREASQADYVQKGMSMAFIFLLSLAIAAFLFLNGAVASTVCAARFKHWAWVALAAFEWLGLLGAASFIGWNLR